MSSCLLKHGETLPTTFSNKSVAGEIGKQAAIEQGCPLEGGKAKGGKTLMQNN